MPKHIIRFSLIARGNGTKQSLVIASANKDEGKRVELLPLIKANFSVLSHAVDYFINIMNFVTYSY